MRADENYMRNFLIGMGLWHFDRGHEESVEGVGGEGLDRNGDVLLAEDLVDSEDLLDSDDAVCVQVRLQRHKIQSHRPCATKRFDTCRAATYRVRGHQQCIAP